MLKRSVLHKSLKWQLPCWVGEWLTCMTEALGAQRRVPQRGPQHKRSSCLDPPRPGTGLGQPTAASGHAPSASETGRVSLCWTSHYSCKRTAAWLTTNQLSDARKRSRNPSLTCFIHVLFQFCIHCCVLVTNVPCATGTDAAYHKITLPFWFCESDDASFFHTNVPTAMLLCGREQWLSKHFTNIKIHWE